MAKSKRIEEFPDYLITEDGRVFSTYTNKYLKPFTDGKRGYNKIKLFKNKKAHTLFIHRLVAITYLPSIDLTLTVNHIDGNKLNNHYLNLEWLTNADNVRHSFTTGIRNKESLGHKKGNTYSFCDEERKQMFAEIIQGNSIRSVALKHNVCVKTLQYQFKYNSI